MFRQFLVFLSCGIKNTAKVDRKLLFNHFSAGGCTTKSTCEHRTDNFRKMQVIIWGAFADSDSQAVLTLSFATSVAIERLLPETRAAAVDSGAHFSRRVFRRRLSPEESPSNHSVTHESFIRRGKTEIPHSPQGPLSLSRVCAESWRRPRSVRRGDPASEGARARAAASAATVPRKRKRPLPIDFGIEVGEQMRKGGTRGSCA